MTTGIYVNPNRKETALQAEELAATLVSRGFGCRKIFRLSEKETEGLDILLVLGGDGTILRCAEICARAGIKIVGITYGTVGFLADFEKDELPSVPDFLLKLNEAALRRDYSLKNGCILQTKISVNGYPFDEISGDGALVCTPTGSTAYSLSAGGPIIAPQTAAILFTPLCAFSLAARPVVFPENDKITLKITRGGAFLLADGVIAAQAEEGDEITAERSDLYAVFPTRAFGGFYGKARKKLS